VARSRKKKPSESVRAAGRPGPADPVATTFLYTLCFVNNYHQSPVSQKSTILARRCEPLPEFPHFRRKFTSFFICFIRIRIRIDRPHAYRSNFSVNLIRLGAVAPKISGLTSSRDFSSRKGHDLLLPTSKHLPSKLDLRLAIFRILNPG